MEYNEANILQVLNARLLSQPQYILNNLYVYDWESDFLAITRSLYAYEVEVKISVSDFHNDFKKTKKHKLLALQGTPKGYPRNQRRPNYFYYGTPPGLITKEDIPPYAGLIYITGLEKAKQHIGPCDLEYVKHAPILHKDKFNIDIHKLTDKFYYNMQNWKKRVFELVDEKGLAEAYQNKYKEQLTKACSRAEEAFARTCPYAYFPFGRENWPSCSLNDNVLTNFAKDCSLECERAKLFKSMLYE